MEDKFLMKGNEALAEAAIQAGCRHFFGYPITPQTELAAYMAKRMPQVMVHTYKQSLKLLQLIWCLVQQVRVFVL